MELYERFEQFSDDYLKFELVEKKRNSRPDLHAFLLLDELFPNPDCSLIDGAEHDEIWLDVYSDQIKSLTDDQILELVRCGIRYDESNECLGVFV